MKNAAKSAARILFLLVLAAALLVPVWLVEFPPLVDYPNHLARSFVLTHLHDPTYRFDRWYAADWGPRPYVVADLLLFALVKVFPAELAGRLLLSFALLAVPLAAWFFLRQAAPGQEAGALWPLLLGQHCFFLLGYLSFYIGLAVCFLTLALCLRWRACSGSFGTAWWLACSSATLLYFTHLLSFAIAGLIIASLLLFERRPSREWFRTVLIVFPGALMFALFARDSWTQRGSVVFRDFSDKLDVLPVLVHSYSPLLDYVVLALFAVWFVAAWWRNADFHLQKPWLAVAGVLFVAYWLIPLGYGDGWDFDIRVLPVLFVVLVAVVRVGPRAKILAPLVLLIFFLRTADMTRQFFAAQPELAGMARAMDFTAPHARVLSIVEAEDDDPVWHSFAHFSAYGVIRRAWFSPYLFDLKDLTPMRITQDSYTLDGFWQLSYPDTPDWRAVQKDYDFVWAYNVPRFSAPLARIGTLVYSSGRLELYRLSPSP